MVLSKNEIIAGINATKIFKIESLGNEEVELRYLSQKELNSIEEIETKAMGTFKTNEKARRARGRSMNQSQLSSEGEIDVHATTQASNKAKIKAVTLALSVNDDEKWKESDVELIHGDVFSEIYEKVREMNHMDENADLEKEVDSFPEE